MTTLVFVFDLQICISVVLFGFTDLDFCSASVKKCKSESAFASAAQAGIFGFVYFPKIVKHSVPVDSNFDLGLLKYKHY